MLVQDKMGILGAMRSSMRSGVGQFAASGAGHYRLAGGENPAAAVRFQLCRPDAERRRGGHQHHQQPDFHTCC